MRTKPVLLFCVTTTALLLAACGGNGATTTKTTTANSSKTAGSLKAIDVCGLVTNAQVAAVGATGSGKKLERPQAKDVQWDACTWGDLATGKPVVVIQTEQLADAPIDALLLLLKSGDTSKNPATPVNVGTNGKLYNVAILSGGGGGGVGKTIAFRTRNGTLVAVSVTGATPDVAALTKLAEAVAAKLG